MIDEYAGLQAAYYSNLAAYEYLYTGRIIKAVDPTHYSGYQEDMYVEEYLNAQPGRLVLAKP